MYILRIVKLFLRAADCFSADKVHGRRGDFADQYNDVIVSIDQIYLSTKDILKPNSIVFIATDDKNKAYFEALSQHYEL